MKYQSQFSWGENKKNITVCRSILLSVKTKTYTINLYHSLGSFSRRQIDDIFSYFSHKTGFDISCKLSPIFIKCQNLFSEKKK